MTSQHTITLSDFIPCPNARQHIFHRLKHGKEFFSLTYMMSFKTFKSLLNIKGKNSWNEAWHSHLLKKILITRAKQQRKKTSSNSAGTITCNTMKSAILVISISLFLFLFSHLHYPIVLQTLLLSLPFGQTLVSIVSFPRIITLVS